MMDELRLHGLVNKKPAPAEVVHGKVSYTTPGNYSFEVPEGVTRVIMFICGGGGGGGAASFGGNAQGAVGGGGGAGATCIKTLDVVPNTFIQLIVGAGGSGQSVSPGNAIPGAAGSASSAVYNSITYTGGGGKGGTAEQGTIAGGRNGDDGTATNGDFEVRTNQKSYSQTSQGSYSMEGTRSLFNNEGNGGNGRGTATYPASNAVSQNGQNGRIDIVY